MTRPSLWSRPWVVALVALLLFAATVASRLPFTSRVLYAWDSANFALALRQYSVALEQPHAPGYPLYVGIASLVNLWVQDANTSYVALSIVASALAVALLFLLGARMYDPWVGLLAATLLGSAVGFWGYGEVAYPYPALALFGTLMALLCYLMWQGHGFAAVLSGLVLGIAGGVRQDALVFLAPLWLVSLWRTGWVRSMLSPLVLGLAVASWLIPAVQLSGGWVAFQQASNAQSYYVLSTYSVFYGSMEDVRRNTGTLLLYLKQMFGLGLLVTIYFAGRFFTFKALVADRRLAFLLLWLLPPVLVYLLVHIGDPGYVLSILPPLCIVTAVGLLDIGRDLRSALVMLGSLYHRLGWLPRLASGAGTALVVLTMLGLMVWNSYAFLATPGPARLPEIRSIDTIVANQVEYARQFPPDSVVVLAKERYRQLRYYLPEHDVRLLYDEYQPDYMEAWAGFQVPEGVEAVLVMDFGRRPAAFPGASGGELFPSGDDRPGMGLWRFNVRPGDTVEYGYDYLGVVPAPGG